MVKATGNLETRLRLFHETTERRRRREREAPVPPTGGDRVGSREYLYARGRVAAATNGVPVFPVSTAAEQRRAPADLELVNRLRDQDP